MRTFNTIIWYAATFGQYWYEGLTWKTALCLGFATAWQISTYIPTQITVLITKETE